MAGSASQKERSATGVGQGRGVSALRFLSLVRHRGVKGAVLHLAGVETVQALSEAWGVDRSRIAGMLHNSSGRTYEPERRTAEVWLGLPPYTLDRVLE